MNRHAHPCPTCHRTTTCREECPEPPRPRRCTDCLIEETVARRATHAARVDMGLDDARAALAEIWRRHSGAGNDSLRDMSYQALGAVIEAEKAMRAADAVVAAKTPGERRKALAELEKSCCTRVYPGRLLAGAGR